MYREGGIVIDLSFDSLIFFTFKPFILLYIIGLAIQLCMYFWYSCLLN